MKLLELIEPRISKATIHQSNNGLDRVRDAMVATNNTQFLGKGKYGTAIQHRNRPNSVIKTGIVGDFASDGYFRYIMTLAKNKWANSNPYFPRVYSIKMYDNNRDGSDDMYVAEIEKLEKLREASREVLMAIGDKAFFNFERMLNSEMRGKHGLEQGKASSSGRKSRHVPKLNYLKQEPLSYYTESRHVANFIGLLLFSAVHERNYQQIKDPLLKQALLLIAKLGEGETNDLAERNLMIRYGPGGGQLVITDPII